MESRLLAHSRGSESIRARRRHISEIRILGAKARLNAGRSASLRSSQDPLSRRENDMSSSDETSRRTFMRRASALAAGAASMALAEQADAKKAKKREKIP